MGTSKVKKAKPKPKEPSVEQVVQEIATLKKMKPKVRHHSMFGDDNHAAIDAQVVVLESLLSERDIYRKYEDPDDETDNTHVLDSALDARRWLDGEEEAPSKAWEGLIS